MGIACCYPDGGCSLFSVVLKMFSSYGKIKPIRRLLLNSRKNALFRLFLFFSLFSHTPQTDVQRGLTVMECSSCLVLDLFIVGGHVLNFDFLEALFGMVTADFCLIRLQLGLVVQPQHAWPSLHVGGCIRCSRSSKMLHSSIRCSGSVKVLHMETKQRCLPLRSWRQFCTDRFGFIPEIT